MDLLILLCMLSCFSRVQLSAVLWTVACLAPLSLDFSRPEYWSGWQCSPAGEPPDPGIEPTSLVSPALAGGFFNISATWKVHLILGVSVFILLCL